MTDGRHEGLTDTTKLPYTVEADDSHLCAHCGQGRMWDVIDPEGVALGTYGDEEAANEVADDLSRAYLAGARAAIKALDPGKADE